MNPLPPQAYTKETLLKAYQWVQNQAPAIRELATTPDLLVSLYLKASRDGDQSLDRPSIHNFKSELRSLADMMGGLERPAAQSVAAPAKPAAPQAATTAELRMQAPKPAPTTAPITASFETSTAALPTLDAQSLEMLKEIKEQFNLSNEGEALRMLIKIGYQKARGWMREG